MHQHKKSQNPHDTSWQKVSPWYNKLVGTDGHFYHEHVVIPGVLRLLDLNQESKLLDLGCGQGILARKIPTVATYEGWDIAPGLIAEAKRQVIKPFARFNVRDVTKKQPLSETQFTHAACILALQNMEKPLGALQTASQQLQSGGRFVIVLNHPCFRIPRQSGWGIDEKTKQQYRWMNRYSSSMKIPIEMHPGQRNSSTTWSFHHSLHDLSAQLLQTGFVITTLEEWTSTKESVGSAARMENRARGEFPLFLSIVAEKR